MGYIQILVYKNGVHCKFSGSFTYAVSTREAD